MGYPNQYNNQFQNNQNQYNQYMNQRNQRAKLEHHPLNNYIAKDIPFPVNFTSIFETRDLRLSRHYEDCDDIDLFCRAGLSCKSYRCLNEFESSKMKPFGLKGKEMCEDDDDCSSEKECVMHRCVEDEDESDANKRNEDNDPSVNLLFAGGIFLNKRAYCSGEQLDGSYNYDHLFQYIQNDIKKADLAIVDQETVFQTDPKFEKKVSNTPPQLGDAIAKAGFKVVLHGTLYAFSKEEKGIKNTLNFWKKYPDIKVLGISESEKDAKDDYYIFTKNGIKIGLVNFYGHGKNLIPKEKHSYINIMTKKSLEDFVEQLSKKTDFVIVCVNWGSKNYDNPSKYQIKWAKDLTKSGANLIIGYHASVVNPISIIKVKNKKSLVFWNLGLLVSDDPKAYSILGAMANITISKADNVTYISEYNMIPTITHKDISQYYTVFKLSQYPEKVFEMSKLNITNITRCDVVKQCQKVMGEIADCY